MSSPSENEVGSDSHLHGTFWIRAVCFVVLFLVPGGVLWFFRDGPESRTKLLKAEAAAAGGDFRSAQQLAMEILQNEDNFRARLVAAKCLDAQSRSRDAMRMLADIPSGELPYSVEAGCLAGDISFLKLYQPTKAAAYYRRALQDDPSSSDANDRLAILLAITGQWWKQIPVRLAALREGRFSRMDLFVMALAETALANPEMAQRMREVSPDEALVLLAASRIAVEDENHDDAVRLLNRALAKKPDLVQAHVALGTEYFHLGDEKRFVDWLRGLPPVADEHPAIWALRGKWAQQNKQPRVALRCFCEAIRRDPNHSDALYQAGRILESMNRSAAASPFFERAQKLRGLINATKAADTPDALTATEQAASHAESLGNYWEAWGWASIAATHPKRPEWAQQMSSRLKPMLATLPLQRTHPKQNPAVTFDYSEFPLLEVVDLNSDSDAVESTRGGTHQFAFRECSESVGIDFTYFNGSHDVANGTRHMYEVMGGGVGVIDFNGDDLPDLYFAQGGAWPPVEFNREFLDRLYVNTVSGRFVDVTESSGIMENRFSQGLTVGDFDSDGFPDLFVANIGQNRLLHNNGDGTFRDVTDAAGFGRSDWSTSCAIVDLTGDGHPELYVVNYLAGSDVFTRTCGPHLDGVCLPQHFPAAANRLYWNPGNGKFQDVTEASGTNIDEGKGLGLVVGTFSDSPELNLFVANDTVANFYFKNVGPGADGVPRFSEIALVSGLAVNRDGSSQACMGVAAGDADGDGATDLFVTNFHGEPNTLYSQLPGGSFEDITLRRRLRQPSLSKLGFGTQFLDADLDGRLDLVVANGHIDDFSQDGRTDYRMQPQFFANMGSAGFREASAETLGPYFERKVLGRSLARLDWNLDGREEFVVSHLDAPTALLQNTTQSASNYVVLNLRGVQSSRDAIGTVVQVETENLKLTRQLTAGDGFQASNQRILTFGLGKDEFIRRMSVKWPTGRSDEFTDIPANSRWIVVEGRQRLFRSPDNDSNSADSGN